MDLSGCLLVLALLTGGAAVQWTHLQDIQASDVSVGPAGVWVVDVNQKIYYRQGTHSNIYAPGTGWINVPGSLVQLDVGDNAVWGVNSANKIYVRRGITFANPTGTDWILVDGLLKHVTVSNEGYVWGVNTNDDIFFREGTGPGGTLTGTRWTNIPGKLKSISAGRAGVWGVNGNDEIYYREGTVGDNGSQGSQWKLVGGSLADIASCDNNVVGSNLIQDIYQRTGLTISNPTGTDWVKLNGGLKTMDCVDSNYFWGVNRQNQLYRGIN